MSGLLVGTSWPGLGVMLLTALGMYAATLLLVRLGGLRSLSRLSAFDFAVTIAMGAVIGGTLTSQEVGLLEGALALAALLGLQRAIAFARVRWGWARAAGPDPLLLVEDGAVRWDDLKRANLAEDELYAGLRAAGVRRLDEVAVVVLERTGDLSVLRSGERPLDRKLLTGVRRLGEGGRDGGPTPPPPAPGTGSR